MDGAKSGGKGGFWPWPRGLPKNNIVGGTFDHNQWSCR